MIGEATFNILRGRYGDLSAIQVPIEFASMDSPMGITLQCFSRGYVMRSDDGYIWNRPDFDAFPIFKDMVELLSIEAAEFFGE